MKKKISLLCLVLACVLVLSGCGCKHETWNEADCLNPKTCAECGETEGEALGHAWVDADCLNPKTCSACGETEGEALGHAWVDADCVNPKNCPACGETEGEALGHTWVEATTEAPKTCSVCGETEGERIITDARFTTAEAQPFFGTWKGDVTISGELLGSVIGYENVTGELPVTVTYTFGNDGNITILTEFSDWDAVMAFMHDFMMDLMYSELAAAGLSKDDADAAMVQGYGMTMEQFVDAALSAMKPEDMNSASEMVYYVENGNLYSADTWNDEMYQETYTLDGDTLTIELEGLGEVVLTRVEE